MGTRQTAATAPAWRFMRCSARAVRVINLVALIAAALLRAVLAA